VIPGDGVGPEVIQEGVKILKVAGEVGGFEFEFFHYPFGGEYYLERGEVLPNSTLSEFREMDAIYLGAIGHPKVNPGVLERGLLLKIRFELDQYINLRPVKLYPGVPTPLKGKSPSDIDFVVIRENTEGLYSGVGGSLRRGTQDEVVVQEMIYTRRGTERCIRYAFEYTQREGRKKVTLCDKSNVLTFGHELWRRVFNEVAKEYSALETDYVYVDACCMWMVKNPEWFDCIVTCNMFGDIITDLGAMIQGGMGVAAGGNINPDGVSMFEPIHGSAPKYAGQGKINPLAAILAGGMMLKHLGEERGASLIERAVAGFLSKGIIKDMGAGKMGLKTSEVGDLVVKEIQRINGG
jgi:3-isopropylmalate dehydrogenase